MDREKVIKALQNCSVQNDVGCQCCPYFEERKTYGHEWCTTSMAQDALALLKEQEAVVPGGDSGMCEICSFYERSLSVKPSTYHHLFICPVCKNTLFRGQKFCHECGKRIEWEGR